MNTRDGFSNSKYNRTKVEAFISHGFTLFGVTYNTGTEYLAGGYEPDIGNGRNRTSAVTE